MTNQDGILRKMEWKLLMDYRGKERAHHRYDLLAYCKMFFPDLKDRKMREIYSDNFCIGHSRKGMYLIDDPQEIDKMIAIMHKKIKTYGKKIVRFEIQKERLVKMRQQQVEQLKLFRRA